MSTSGPTDGDQRPDGGAPTEQLPAEQLPSGGLPTGPGTSQAADVPPTRAKQSILASSALMAAGTLFSRFSGVFRSILLTAALGSVGVAADAFTLANTVPNMLYILLAGGVFNAVLVPQLVRAIKNDPDGGDAYTHRIMTLGLLFLGGVTVLLVVLAPQLLHLFLDSEWYEPEKAAALDSTTTLARWCLPQVFFYGMFTLVGQVLNARGSFGPMMWAPIANNVIAVGVLVAYLVFYGPVSGAAAAGDLSAGQAALLGLGSTVGIAVQLLVLVPFMRRAGYRYSPRFDFRGTGLSHTARLAVWTVLFVVVNQVAYTVVVRQLSAGTAAGEAGQMIYANSFMIMLLPHGIVTVSLVTALLPRLSSYAAEGHRRDLALTLTSTLRTALVVVLPVAAALLLLGTDIANVLWGWGASAGQSGSYGLPLSFFGLALVFFTVHYFMLRGFYALERTRTVFLVQLVVGGVNIATAIGFTALVDPEHGAGALAASYALAYLCGAVVSWIVLRRALGSMDGRSTLRFAVRMVLAVGLALLLAAALWLALDAGREDTSPAFSLLRGGGVGLVYLTVYYVLTRMFRIQEVAEVVDPLKASVGRRLKRRRRA